MSRDRGVVPARPVTRSSHALSLSVVSHPSREARRIVFDSQGSRITPPAPPFARGGKGSLARNLIPSRAIKTRVSKPSLQLGQHRLFTGPGSPLPLLALIWRPDGVKRPEMGSKRRSFGGICYVAHNGATPLEDKIYVWNRVSPRSEEHTSELQSRPHL